MIRASRTAGGHRRIPIAEAVRFIRATEATVVQPEVLGLRDVEAVSPDERSADNPDAFLRFLEEGDGERVRGFLIARYLGGESIAELFDRRIRPAMETIGARWREQADGVYVEHRATDLCVQAITQLRLLLPPSQGPTAVGGAISGDVYLLPAMMATTILAELGFQSVNLGPDTPISALRHAIEEYEAVIAWISVSRVEDPASRGKEIQELLASLSGGPTHLVLGGREQRLLPLESDPRLLRAGTMSELAAFARGMRSS